jgi:dipeptidyl aminopeptidase/acylaminoacyl peptidase
MRLRGPSTQSTGESGGRSRTGSARCVLVSALLCLAAIPGSSCAGLADRNMTSPLEGASTAGTTVPVGRVVAITEGDCERAGELYLFTVRDEPRQLSDVASMPGTPGRAKTMIRRSDGSFEARWVETVSYPELGSAAISPDGKWVAYSLSDPAGGGCSIWVLGLDGDCQPSQLTKGAWDSYPCWAPDSRKIAFVRKTTVGTSSVQNILEVTVEPPHKTRVLAGLDHKDGLLCPSWSPDGSTLLFERRDVVPPNGIIRRVICRVDIASGDISELPVQAVSSATPTWFPDGTRIAYSATKGGAWHIYTSKPNGDDEQLLVGTRCTETNPTVSPDGRYVGFLRRSGKHGKFERVYFIDTDTRKVTLLTPSRTLGWEAICWGPAPVEEKPGTKE